MSDEFDGLDATEKAGFEAALNRCRRLAAQIASELRNKRLEHFVDKLALAGPATLVCPKNNTRRFVQKITLVGLSKK
jgi:hypothetical protein